MQFHPSAYSRADRDLPEARLINMYYETTPTTGRPFALLQRPGLVEAFDVGAGPIRGGYKENNVFSGDNLVVSGNTLYQGSTSKGTIGTSTGLVRMTAGGGYLVIVDPADGRAWSFDGTTVAEITDADLPDVIDCKYFLGRFYFAAKDSSTFYFSALNDPTTIDGLSFMSAESSPDKIEAMETLGDNLVIFGTETVEFHFPTGDADAPLQRAQSRTYTKGAIRHTVARADNGLFWVGTNRIPYRGGGNVPEPLYNPATGEGAAAVEAIVSAGATNAYVTHHGAHEFYVVNVPGVGTYAYDITTQRWCKWESSGDTVFRVSIAFGTFLGSASGSKIYAWSETAYKDDGLTMTRIAPAIHPVQGIERGETVRLITRTDADVAIEMRQYDTAWGAWKSATTLRGNADWRRDGRIRTPGRHYEFRITADANVALIGVSRGQTR
jgi:hypothetical protein